MSEKDQLIEELTARVAQLEDENHQLQLMLQKVIKKYKKLKDKKTETHQVSEPQPPDAKKHTKSNQPVPLLKKSPDASPLETSASSISIPPGDITGALLQNIEYDSLSFVQSVLPSITVNYYFETNGNYLIHEAVKAGAIKILHFICAKGADMNSKSRAGESPLTLGAEENKHDAMCIILQHGREKIDLDYHNNAGMTALQIAVKNGNKEIVSLLIAHGANVNSTNVLGDSLIKMAQRSGHQEIVLLLVNSGASLR